jgi:replicative DNA helicase
MSYRTGESLWDAWWDHVTATEPPALWSAADPVFESIEIAPGRIVLLGGGPFVGKTALLLQWIIGILINNSNLHVIVANVEMTPFDLLDRQLARLSGVALSAIYRRKLDSDELRRLASARDILRPLIVERRLGFADDPHRLGVIAKDASDLGAHLLVLDYLQRIHPAKPAKDGMRERINLLMSELRQLANEGGVGILAAAALTRTRDSKGRGGYDGKHLSLASFRESSELEYGADDCLLLYPTDDDHDAPVRPMTLAHAKARYSATRDRVLVFDRPHQEFTVPADPRADRVAAATAWGDRPPESPNGKEY